MLSIIFLMTTSKKLRDELTLSPDLPCDKDINGVVVYKENKKKRPWHPELYLAYHYIKGDNFFSWLDT